MGKNILILGGSPRRDGNSEALADAFARGARRSGHETAFFAAGQRRLQGCQACEACWSGESACVVPDDFLELSPLLEKAEVLVLAAPLYWFGFPAQLKAAVDRLYAYMSERRKRALGIGEAVLLMCAHDSSPGGFAGAVETYRSVCSFLGWRDRGILTVPGVGGKGEIEGHPALAAAEKLGAGI